MNNSNNVKITLVATIIVLILIISFIIANDMQKRIIFEPSRRLVWKPTTPYNDLFIGQAKDGHIIVRNNINDVIPPDYIHIWHFDNIPNTRTVLFSHGTTGNISHRDYVIDFCSKFKLNLLLFDYHGYGLSSIRPDTKYIYKNGLLAYRYLITKVDPKSILVWGESLGGTVATYIAAKSCKNYLPCNSLVLLCTFSSLDDVARFKYGFITSLLVRLFHTMPSKRYIRDVTCPVIIMHSKEDEIIPYECSEILYREIRHPIKKLITIKGYHPSPIITENQLAELFNFCHLDTYFNVDSSEINQWLEDLQTVAERHNLTRKK